MALEREQAWYKAHKEELLARYKDRWVVIHDDRLVGDFESFEEAYSRGIERTQSEDILVRRVVEKDEPFSAPALVLGLLGAPVYQ